MKQEINKLIVMLLLECYELVGVDNTLLSQSHFENVSRILFNEMLSQINNLYLQTVVFINSDKEKTCK